MVEIDYRSKAQWRNPRLRVGAKAIGDNRKVQALLLIFASPFLAKSQSPRIPIAILAAFFDETGATADGAQTDAYCPATSGTVLHLDFQHPPIYSLSGTFGSRTCKLVYSLNGRTLLTLNQIPIDGSHTTYVIAIMASAGQPPHIIVQPDPVLYDFPIIDFTIPQSMYISTAQVIAASDPDPKVTGSIDCGFWGPYHAQAVCSAKSQHPECSCTSVLGWGKATCGCANGAAVAPAPVPNFPPHGHWQVITFTSNNSPLPDHGYVTLTAPSGQQRQLQDIGATPVKLAMDVQFICSTINLNCPTNGWDTAAIPWGATLQVDATITVREVQN